MMDINEIREILPHRYPFLLVDRVTEVVEGKSIILSMDEFKGKIPMFAGADKVKWRKPVVPGDRLDLSCEIIKLRGPIGIGKAVATVDGKKVCEAEIMFAIG